MRNFFKQSVVSLLITSALLFSLVGCGKSGSDTGSNTNAPEKSSGFNGRYIAGVKRPDGVTELFRLDITKQGNDLNGNMDFLTTMLDSIDDNPQKVDLQVFENFAEHDVKVAGKVTGNSVEFSQVDPFVVGNYMYSWHFKGQTQGDKLVGQFEEKMKTDATEKGQEPTENAQTFDITFTKAEGK